MISIGIGIGIGDTGPVFTWYRIDTKICSIAHPWGLIYKACVRSDLILDCAYA